MAGAHGYNLFTEGDGFCASTLVLRCILIAFEVLIPRFVLCKHRCVGISHARCA